MPECNDRKKSRPVTIIIVAMTEMDDDQVKDYLRRDLEDDLSQRGIDVKAAVFRAQHPSDFTKQKEGEGGNAVPDVQAGQ